jgi:hypothetical protein
MYPLFLAVQWMIGVYEDWEVVLVLREDQKKPREQSASMSFDREVTPWRQQETATPGTSKPMKETQFSCEKPVSHIAVHVQRTPAATGINSDKYSRYYAPRHAL